MTAVNWSSFLQYRSNVVRFVLLAAFTLLLLYSFAQFMVWNETRSAPVLNDFILNYITPIDLSKYISTLTLIPIFAGQVYLFRLPEKAVEVLYATIFICLFRTMTLYLFPLDPPITIISLTDPVIEELFYAGNRLNKDLFFSGHTANLVLIGLLLENKILKTILFIFAVIVGAMLMMQHVHYSVDVFFAPPFAWFSYKLSLWATKSTFIFKHVVSKFNKYA